MQQSPIREKRIKGEGYRGSKGKDKFAKQRQEEAKATPLVPMNEKQRGYLRALEANTPIIVATGYAGCVDEETEFLSQHGWKFISEYDEGDLVSQFDPATREEQLVEPLEYIQEPCSVFVHFTSQDIDQKLSLGHNIAYLTDGGSTLAKMAVKDFHARVETLDTLPILIGKQTGEGIQYVTTDLLDAREVLYAKNATQYCFEVPSGFLVLRRNGKVFVTGNSSKTYIPTRWACLQHEQDRLYKFVLTRPAVSNSKSLGYFTGDPVQKMTTWLGPVLSVIKETLGSARTEIAIKREDITFIPLEVIKGTSLSSTDPNRPIVFLVEEASDLTKEEVIKLITRVGKNCILVLAGDLKQSELKEHSGLAWLIRFMNKHQMDGFFHVDFNDVNDIVRSDVVKKFITCLERDSS